MKVLSVALLAVLVSSSAFAGNCDTATKPKAPAKPAQFCGLRIDGHCVKLPAGAHIKADDDVNVVINGNVHDVTTTSGNITIFGSVAGDVSDNSGDVVLHNIPRCLNMTGLGNVNDFDTVSAWAAANDMELVDATGKVCQWRMK